jgi:hypothetical protein
MDPEKRTDIKRVLLIVQHAINGHDELDEHVLIACGARKTPGGRWRIGEGAGTQLMPYLAKVTQSVDAALSLREEVLPGWSWSLLPMDATLWTGTDAVLQERLPRVKVTADAMTTPLSICAAILKAMLALADAQAKQTAV